MTDEEMDEVYQKTKNLLLIGTETNGEYLKFSPIVVKIILQAVFEGLLLTEMNSRTLQALVSEAILRATETVHGIRKSVDEAMASESPDSNLN